MKTGLLSILFLIVLSIPVFAFSEVTASVTVIDDEPSKEAEKVSVPESAQSDTKRPTGFFIVGDLFSSIEDFFSQIIDFFF